MAKRKSSQAESTPAASAAVVESAPVSETVEAPALAPTIEPAVAEAPKIESQKVEMSAIEASKTESPTIEPPAIEASKVEAPAAKIAAASPRSNRFALLAASVALAAALGAVAGALGASGILRIGTTSQAATASDTAALQATIGKLHGELASLRASVDTANGAARGQFSKIAERFDRVERGQSERSGKLAKAVQMIERIEKRADAHANDVTGSIKTAVPTPVAAPAPKRPIIRGWTVRRVRGGVILLENNRLGLVAVERGDVLPPVGRIEQVKKEDGHWVVVTSRGLITSMR